MLMTLCAGAGGEALMTGAAGDGTPLRIIRGGRDDLYREGLRVTLIDPEKLPDGAQGVVVEEDTWQVLATPPEFHEEREHPIRIMRAIHNARPLPPGSVLVREGTPVTFVAVVYDTGEEPVCRTEWIAAALSGIMALTGERKLGSLALPLPGVRHGRIPVPGAVVLLVTALRELAPPCLKRIWLAVPPEDRPAVRRCWSAERSDDDDHDDTV
jgi:hypothetical protein